MRSTVRRPATPLFVLTFLVAAAAAAQSPPLKVPQPSPKATVSQTVGVTEIAIT